MKLDFKNVGENIRTMREQKGFSQEKLIDLINERYDLHYTRQRLGRIENGDGGNILTLDLINALAEIFECDAGYLLGEIKERTYDIKEVCEITSLSEEAVSKILSLKNGHGSKTYNTQKWGQLLSKLITHDSFTSIMESIQGTIICSRIYNKIAAEFMTGNISEETKEKENDLHREYVSNLWYISNEFSSMVKDIVNNSEKEIVSDNSENQMIKILNINSEE